MNDEPDELKEKDFIHEEYSRSPFTFWIWTLIIAAGFAFLWGTGSWFTGTMIKEREVSPFYQVTNREYSLFIWQNPEYMRVDGRDPRDSRPPFTLMGKGFSQADELVDVPPRMLFLYHTWSRLLRNEWTPRPIPSNEFREFLAAEQEWLPQYWPDAPKGYRELVASLSTQEINNLQKLPRESLPQEVRIAFQGWKNFTLEGDEIRYTEPTYASMQLFLEAKPDYQRNFWRNILVDSTPNYLKTITFGTFEPNEKIPNNEITSFLRIAYFNYMKAKVNR